MSVRSWSSAVFALIIVALGAACSTEVEEEEAEQSSDLSEPSRSIDPNRLLEDDEILGDQDMDTDRVQAILVCFSSGLATYSEGGRSAAQIIADESRREGVSPAYMLARIQTESLLVESTKKRDSRLATAAGCGCPDGKPCNPAYRGFTKQVVCAAKLVRSYFRSLDESGVTVTGMKVGEWRTTSDPCMVRPENRASAVLYTYTPWVGSRGVGCGSVLWSGSTGVAYHTRKYRRIR
jgi:hypothetical protein